MRSRRPTPEEEAAAREERRAKQDVADALEALDAVDDVEMRPLVHAYGCHIVAMRKCAELRQRAEALEETIRIARDELVAVAGLMGEWRKIARETALATEAANEEWRRVVWYREHKSE